MRSYVCDFPYLSTGLLRRYFSDHYLRFMVCLGLSSSSSSSSSSPSNDRNDNSFILNCVIQSTVRKCDKQFN